MVVEMEDKERLAFISMPSIKDSRDMQQISEWLNKMKLEGWHFIIGTDFHALSKDEVEALYVHLGVMLEKN